MIPSRAMRPLVIPSVLLMAPLALGCSDTPSLDAMTEASAVVDASDAGDALDVLDAMEEPGVDIQFSERRVDVAPPDGSMCITERNDAGAVVCREEGFPVGSGEAPAGSG